jgi:predicted nucleotide-binding protein (sugar kinase/HSP70/actin superfamily)
MAYTSGKECYPCQITTGDILHFMQIEADRLGADFDPEDYVYFMPEADGPCRFGMYNKYQRIVLDTFPDLDRLKIGSLTTGDGYSLSGLIEASRVSDLRKVAYLSQVVGDILDRLLWRIRPYETEAGRADRFVEEAMHRMAQAFETYGGEMAFDRIYDRMDDVMAEGKAVMDPGIPPRPLIGIVGEIYLRTHVQANQDVIRMLEKYGAEVVNASVCEWMNYTSYDRLRESKYDLWYGLRQLRPGAMKASLKRIMGFAGDLYYQQFRQKQTYERACATLDLAGDHRIGHLEDILKEDNLFSFDVGTEACLSIAGLVAYAREGYNGLVNVYPFTCMPSTTTSSIVRPLMTRLRVPYLDTPYDSSYQPGREASIRTFMYQAEQHFKRYGRRNGDH